MGLPSYVRCMPVMNVTGAPPPSGETFAARLTTIDGDL
jgi:hypothetical protein